MFATAQALRRLGGSRLNKLACILLIGLHRLQALLLGCFMAVVSPSISNPNCSGTALPLYVWDRPSSEVCHRA